MRSLAEVQADRTEAIRNDSLYRFRLALRDERDYSNDEVEEVKPQEIIHRHSNMGKQEFRLLEEHDRVIKYLSSKQGKGKPTVKPSTYKGLTS